MDTRTLYKKIDNLSVSYSDDFGGAAKAAYRINDCLQNTKINSKLLVVKKISDSKNVITITNRFELFFFKIKNKILILFKKILRNKVDRSFNIFDSPILNLIKQIDPKIVNLNWIGAETLSIKDISKIENSKILFTLHDMWAFCGAEHYVNKVENSYFINGYKYSQSKTLFSLIDTYLWKLKKKYWKNFFVITPSKWLREQAISSKLMKKKKIFVIPYPINTNKYKRDSKKKYKKKINILFSAFGNINNPRKGFGILKKILNKLDPDKFTLNIIGQYPDKTINNKYKINFYHSIKEENKIIKILQKCDVCVFTSIIDNFPLVLMEAQACGLPCIAFNTGGIKEIIRHNKTGFLVEPFNENDFKNKIQLFLNDRKVLKQFSVNSRKHIENNFSYKNIRKKYEKLYKKIL